MPAPDLSLLIDAAREAGEIAKSFWDGENRVWDKGKDDPVSEADIATDDFLRDALTNARPSYGWMSEETEDDSARLKADRLFIVDPIDGTRAFIGGQTTWAHSLAVVEDGRVSAGVVYLPLRGKIYAAAIGEGATLNGAPLAASTNTSLGGATLLSNKWTLEPKYWRELPPVDRHFRPSLAYRMSLVAEGRFDMMLTFRDSWEWDIAAGSLITKEAGALCTDRTGAPLNFNSVGRKAAGVLAAPRALHEAMRARMK